MLNWDNLKKYKTGIVLLLIGIVLFIFLSVFSQNEKDEDIVYVSDEQKHSSTSENSYDTVIEKKLEKILVSTEGVGKVKVAVSLLDSGEIYPFSKEENSNETTEEKDSTGGTRDSVSSTEKSEVSLIKESDGSESVVITKSDLPKISGVIVCAEGGDSYVVKERIIMAVKALCNIDITRIEILPMK